MLHLLMLRVKITFPEHQNYFMDLTVLQIGEGGDIELLITPVTKL